MSTSSKSPKEVFLEAYKVGVGVFPLYSHESSPHKYTQPQLFACLVLKTFLKMDYRGVVKFLEDFSEVRELINLKGATHFTTLQKACRRLLERSSAKRLLEQTLEEFTLKKALRI